MAPEKGKRKKAEDVQLSKKIFTLVTREEYDTFIRLAAMHHRSLSQLARLRITGGAGRQVISAMELLRTLDAAGTALSQSADKINALLRYTQALQRQGLLSPFVAEKFNQTMQEYIAAQWSLESAISKILKAMAKSR